MQYDKRSQNGDAGENLAVARVIKLFGWPCRLQKEADLGIDAEIEIMEGDGSSSGNLIKVQIKTVDSIKSDAEHAIYVDDRHIEYWKTFCLPILVFCVDLQDEQIYWKQIYQSEAFKSGGESKKIRFSIPDDQLEAIDRVALSQLGFPDSVKHIGSELEKLRRDLVNLPHPYYNQLITEESIDKAQRHSDQVKTTLSAIEELRRHYPWRFSPADLELLRNATDFLRVARLAITKAGNELYY